MQNQVEILQDDQPLNPYTEIQILHDHSDVIKFLLPINEDKFLSVADDNTGIIWEVGTALKRCTLEGHTRPITCACLLTPPLDEESREAELLTHCLLLTGSSDRTVRVWSTENGACLQVIAEHNAATKAILGFPNSGIFCTGGQDLHLWSSSGQLLHQVKQDSEAVTNCPIADINHMLALTDDRFVVAAGSALEVYGIDGQIGHVGDTSFQLRRVKKLVPQHREDVMCLTRISDSYFASASLDGTVKVWNSHTLSTSRQLNHIKDYEKNGFPWCVQHMLALDGKHLCITIGSGLAVYDVMSGECAWKQTHAHFSKITHIAVVCDGKFLTTCSEDGTIRLWGVNPRLKGGDESDCPQKGLTISNLTAVVQASHHRQAKETRSRLFRREESRLPILCLQGECVAHSGAVQMVLDFPHDGMASCGVDGLVILWKDGVLESAKRNDLIREMLYSKSGMF